MEDILSQDKKLLVFLNNLGSETFDPFWLFITNQFYLTPVFLFVFYLLWKKIGWKKLGIVLLFIALIIMVCDQTTNLFKYTFERLRPVNDLEIKEQLRIIISRKSFSFFSGHASNSMATTLFLFLIFRKYYKYAFLLFLFPLIFAYSRIYLGLHFPSDILTGFFFGSLVGVLFYFIYKKADSESLSQKKSTLFITFTSVLFYFVMCNILVFNLK
ncbi:MAG: phosphatase PAP2 family protein [Flavobacteriaceae bacterium]